jgi:type I restriction enzyme S subunit
MVERQISPFFALCINSQSVRAIIVSKGAALKHLHLVDLRALPFPLPPLAEQSRIVAKVDQLMALCDQLEARLGAAQTERRRLLAAVLHEAVAPAA